MGYSDNAGSSDRRREGIVTDLSDDFAFSPLVVAPGGRLASPHEGKLGSQVRELFERYGTVCTSPNQAGPGASVSSLISPSRPDVHQALTPMLFPSRFLWPLRELHCACRAAVCTGSSKLS